MLGIMNAALIAQGQYEIVNENEASDEWRLFSRNWPQIVEAELEDGNYNFTRQDIEATGATAGRFGFEYAYPVPAAALHVRRAWILGVQDTQIDVDWAQDGSFAYCNEADGIHMEFVVSSEPHLWSANFVRGVQCRLEALILRAIKEEASEAQGMEAQADIYFQRARTISSKARRATDVYRKGPIANARFMIRGAR